jgi:hypothetical protein
VDDRDEVFATLEFHSADEAHAEFERLWSHLAADSEIDDDEDAGTAAREGAR